MTTDTHLDRNVSLIKMHKYNCFFSYIFFPEEMSVKCEHSLLTSNIEAYF